MTAMHFRFLLGFGCALISPGCAVRGFQTYAGPSDPSDPGNPNSAYEKIFLKTCKDTMLFRTRIIEAPAVAVCGPKGIYYLTPSPGAYHLHSEFYFNDTTTYSITGFEIRAKDSILASETYPEPESISSVLSESAYCDKDGCRMEVDNRKDKGTCVLDSITPLSVAAKYRLPTLDSVLLSEKIRIRNRHCDTVFVLTRKWAMRETGGRVLVVAPDPHGEFKKKD